MSVLQTLQTKPIIITSSGLADWGNADRELSINEMSATGKVMMGVDPCTFSHDSSWTQHCKIQKLKGTSLYFIYS